jgi:uncharacterized protein
MARDEEGKDHVQKATKAASPSPEDEEHGPASLENYPEEGLYGASDLTGLQMNGALPVHHYVHTIGSVEDLLQRDAQREKDGFPRKIRVGKLIKPARGGRDKVIIVPTTVEEKFYHDTRPKDEDESQQSGGAGGGKEGEVIGEEPMQGGSGGDATGPGQGEASEHEIEANLYDLGRILTEQFQLPNLKNKGAKRSLKKFTYELTDKNIGHGQILDKKATLRKVIETNIGLDRLPNLPSVDPTDLLVSPRDSVYRILSKEQDYDSQALVFFIRDFSASMSGEPTAAIVAQHVMIYSWLLYQYEGLVETRFILHDTEAKEVPDFYTYHNLSTAGGTKIESAYKLINEIIEAGSLDHYFNIYVFQGTDGDDWDLTGEHTLPEARKILGYCNRLGVTVVDNRTRPGQMTTVEKHLIPLAKEQPEKLRVDTITENRNEARLIAGIRKLIS